MLHKTPLSKKDKSKGLRLPEKVSTELAYLAGIFAGDGSLSYREKKNEYSLKCVGNPKDEKELYYQIIGPLFRKEFGCVPVIKYFDNNKTFGFRIFSKSLIMYLTKEVGLPLSPKYERLRIPSIFQSDEQLSVSFIRGLFDTDGCISFKKKYREYPYYPVISFASKSRGFVREIAGILKRMGFKVVETYDYKIMDKRAKEGFTVINKIELNGRKNLSLWIKEIGFYSPKHKEKIRRYWKE